jgi:5'-nucleotidase
MSAMEPIVQRVLLTNDDGIDAPGLQALAAAAVQANLDVVVAAPAEPSSGASASLAAVRRHGRTALTRRRLPGLPDVAAWAVEAPPGHIVVAALNGWLDPVPDLVLSGINRGANVGRAVLHSGTVGAALTAGLKATPALAVSLAVALHPVGEQHWATAAAPVPAVLELLLSAPRSTVLSLNVPDRPVAGLRPLRHARLARHGAVRARVEDVRDGRLRLVEVEVSDPPEDGTDGALLQAGHPTLTALRSVDAADGSLVERWLARRGSGR